MLPVATLPTSLILWRAVMRARRIMAGFRRIGIVLALILSLPVFFGLWTWVTVGQPPPKYVYIFLAGGLGAYILATSIGWIAAGFSGEED
jgi:formate hydrogenlyase subunit 3/multisubunit Na+/H+ antiporter MnhD subunit